MALQIPERPPRIVCSGDGHGMRIAKPIAGASQWYELAQATGWLIGKGNTLMSGTPIEDAAQSLSITQGATGLTVTYFVAPKSTTKSYVWFVTLIAEGTSDGSGGTASGEFQNLSATKLGSWALGPEHVGTGKAFRVLHHASGTPTFDAMSLKILNYSTSQKKVRVAGISLVELPRRTITSNPSVDSCRSKQPIFEESDLNQTAIDGVVRALPTARESARRPSLLHWWSPTAHNNATSSFVLVSDGLIRPRNTDGSTTRSLAFRAFVRATGGDGELRVRTGLLGSFPTATTTVTVSNSGYDYVSGTIDAPTEDPENLLNAGLRNDDRCIVDVFVRKTTGTSIDIKGFHLYEPI